MSDEERIRRLVRRVVYRTLGRSVPEAAGERRPLITESDVQAAIAPGELTCPEGAVITPLARQLALERRIRLVEERTATRPRELIEGPFSAAGQSVAIGADHGGFELKQQLVAHLETLGHRVLDCGTNSEEAVDYPDLALAVAQLVASGRAWRGILVDGAGIGSCMAANKVPGVRAAMCYDQATAVNSREHNDANVLTLGAGLIGAPLAKQIVTTWLATSFGGGRHGRRVDKIVAIERRYAS